MPMQLQVADEQMSSHAWPLPASAYSCVMWSRAPLELQVHFVGVWYDLPDVHVQVSWARSAITGATI